MCYFPLRVPPLILLELDSKAKRHPPEKVFMPSWWRKHSQTFIRHISILMTYIGWISMTKRVWNQTKNIKILNNIIQVYRWFFSIYWHLVKKCLMNSPFWSGKINIECFFIQQYFYLQRSCTLKQAVYCRRRVSHKP